MTNDEIRKKLETRNPKGRMAAKRRKRRKNKEIPAPFSSYFVMLSGVRHSDFGFLSDFDIRHSSFGFGKKQAGFIAPSRSLGPRSGQDDRHRAAKDLKIQPQRPVVNVFQVQPDPVRKILHVAPPADLPQAGDS